MLELEPTGEQRFDQQPEIDLEQIDDFASGAPKKNSWRASA